jgi:hypothetical protein
MAQRSVSQSAGPKVVGMAVPPGPAMGISFLTNLDQLKRSWYMFFFQHGLAEAVVSHEQMAFIEMIWRDWSPGYAAEIDVDHVRAAIAIRPISQRRSVTTAPHWATDTKILRSPISKRQ